jgi:hypothetical protein
MRAARSECPAGSIEIEIAGARIKVLGQVDAEQLRVVLAALRAPR